MDACSNQNLDSRLVPATGGDGGRGRQSPRCMLPREASLAIRFLLVVAAIGGSFRGYAQSVLDAPAASPLPPTAGQTATAAPAASASAEKSSLPRAFREIELGMDREAVIAGLKKDPLYSYRGPEDVSLLPSPNQSLIDVSGLSFVKRAFFQFYEGKLWVMILELNPDKIDHYSVFTSLTAKYGEPTLLDPKEARWEDKETRVALERPLVLRYMDMAVYGKLRESSSAKESVDELDRKDFLGGL